MAQPTATDLKAAYQYSAQRAKLLKIQQLYKTHPHIASKLTYTITDADPDNDYYFKESFKHRAIMVDVVVTKDVCDAIKCIPWHTKGPCKVNDAARYYRIGETDKFDVSCAPACFNLKDKITYNESSEPETQIPTVEWNKYTSQCLFASPAKTWMDFPITRDSARYTKRLNNFELGFDRIDNPVYLNGYKYGYNQYYCDQFDTNLKDGNCKEPFWMIFITATIGDALYKTMAASIRQITTGTDMKPSDLPAPPAIEDEWLVANWKRNVNSNFVVPDPETETRNSKSRTARSLLKFNPKIKSNERRNLDHLKSSSRLKRKRVPKTEEDKELEKLKEKIKEYMDEMAVGSTTTQFDQVMTTILSMFDAEFLQVLGIDIALTSISAIIKKLGGRLSNFLFKMSTKVGTSIGTKILRSSLITMTTKVVASVMLKSSAKVVVALTKIASLASSVVGVILIVVMLADLLLMFFDPMGFNNMFPEGYLDQLQSAYDAALIQQTGKSIPEMDFDILYYYLIDENVSLETAFEEFTWVYEYLDHLTVNSEGSRISKGEEIILNDPNQDLVGNYGDELAADDLKIYTQTELKEYEDLHFKRLKSLRLLNVFGLLSVGVATGLLFISPFLTVIGLLFALLIFLLAYMCIVNDFVFEVNLFDMYDQISDWLGRKGDFLLGKQVDFLLG